MDGRREREGEGGRELLPSTARLSRPSYVAGKLHAQLSYGCTISMFMVTPHTPLCGLQGQHLSVLRSAERISC